jgi:hypothetical protein
MKRFLAILATVAALPAFAYYPEFVRTSLAHTNDIVRPLGGDFNGDGRPDIVYRTIYHQIRLTLTQSDGTLAASSLVYQADYLSDFAVADVNGDDKVDIVISDTATNTLIALLSNGDGTFASPVMTTLPFAPTQIATGDFNGDGKLDLAIRSYSAETLAIYGGDGAGNFTEISTASLNALTSTVVAGDVDGDGKQDVVSVGFDPVVLYEVRYGDGDGTLEAPVALPGTGDRPTKVIVADLDNDGDEEIISCEFNTNTVTVRKNLGGRTFADPVAYVVASPDFYYSRYGNPIDVVAADVTGDGILDVVVTLANIKSIGTLPGNGDGTLGSTEYSGISSSGSYYTIFPETMVAGDFNGDGRVDIAVSAQWAEVIVMMTNQSGISKISLRADHPTTTLGQPATFTVTIKPADGLLYPYPYTPPVPTGTVTLTEGATVMGSGSLQNGSLSLSVNSLAAGAHTFTASFSGDTSYRSGVSSSATVNVVLESTATTLTSNTSGRTLSYGESFQLTATTTSPIPDPLNGSYYLYTDGLRSDYPWSGPPANMYISALVAPGSHAYYVTYEGNATQPPSKSNTITENVRKAVPTASLSSNLYVNYATNPTILLQVRAPFSGSPQGPVQLYEGTVLLATSTLGSGGYVYIPTPALPPGAHYLYCSYAGDTNFEPAQSPLLKISVIPNSTLYVDVTLNDYFITATAFITNPPTGLHYNVYRRVGSGAWSNVGTTYSYYWNEYSAQPGVVYAFKMEALDSNNFVVATSNADLAMRVSFADDVLTPLTRIKAQHIQELVDATNIVRSAAGLGPLNISDAGVGQTIRASHILAIRTAINEARTALGVTPVTFSNDAGSGSIIRVQHIQELREALH